MRTYKLRQPHMVGQDVRVWQKEIVNEFKRMGINYPLKADGDYGYSTRDAMKSLCHALGMNTDVLARGVTLELRIRIRHRKLTVYERIRMAKRVRYRRALRDRYNKPSTPKEPRHTSRFTPNKSYRSGRKPRLIVLHATEGSYEGAVDWLTRSESRASSHIVVSREGKTTRLVPDSRKAWHAADTNSYSLGLEQEGYSSSGYWPKAELETSAAWIAYWAHKYNIPITSSTSRGVCTHSSLGLRGGGHHDPGRYYPLNEVLAMARKL